MKKSIWIIIIGIFLLAIDIHIPIGEIYPDMVKAIDLGEVLQNKVSLNFIGTQPTMDILSEVLGFILIFIGAAGLLKNSKKFILAMLLVPIAIALYVIIPGLPYHFEARDLYLMVAGYTFLLVIIEILIEYYVIHGIVSMTNCMQNKWHNNEMLAGWIIAMMSKGLLVGIDFFFGQHTFYLIYSIVMIAATAFYVNRLLTTLDFKQEGNPPKRKTQEPSDMNTYGGL